MSIHVPLWYTSDVEGSASQLAYHAYCYYVFGKAHGLLDARAFGRQMCSRALQVLHTTSRDGETPSETEQMATVHWLIMFEIATSTEVSHIITYGSCMVTVVAAFGPQKFAEPQNVMLFEHVRWALILASLLTESSCIMAEQTWLTVTWSDMGRREKPIEQQLLDVMVLIHELRQQSATLKLRQAKFVKSETIDQVWRSYARILADLKQWYHRHSARVRVYDWYTPRHWSRVRGGQSLSARRSCVRDFY